MLPTEVLEQIFFYAIILDFNMFHTLKLLNIEWNNIINKLVPKLRHIDQQLYDKYSTFFDFFHMNHMYQKIYGMQRLRIVLIKDLPSVRHPQYHKCLLNYIKEMNIYNETLTKGMIIPYLPNCTRIYRR